MWKQLFLSLAFLVSDCRYGDSPVNYPDPGPEQHFIHQNMKCFALKKVRNVGKQEKLLKTKPAY